MEKQKRWQLYLILAVIILTLYNILPTIFFYSKPLKDPITAPRAETVAKEIVQRVNSLEDESKAWLGSFSKLLGVKPVSIELKADDPRLIEVSFSNKKEAALFKRFLPQAGRLIAFVPAQLELYPDRPGADPSKVYVARQIGLHLKADEVNKLFHFSPKMENGQVSPLYKEITFDRATQVALGLAGPSKAAAQVATIAQNENESSLNDLTINLAKEIVDMEKTLGKASPILKRYFASFTQTDSEDKETSLEKFTARVGSLKSELEKQKADLLAEQKQAKEKNEFLSADKQQHLSILDSQIQALSKAGEILNKNMSAFKAGSKPFTEATIQKALTKNSSNDTVQVLSLEGRNPFVEAVVIDWGNDKILTKIYSDVQALRLADGKTESVNYLKEKMNQYVINDIARVSRFSDENIQPNEDSFSITLNELSGTNSFLTFDLGYLAEKLSMQLQDQLSNTWVPEHPNLKREVYPIHDFATFKTLKPEDQKLGLVVYAPSMYESAPPAGFRKGSLYVIARGLDTILKSYQQTPDAPESKVLTEEINHLSQMLALNGFIAYPGSSYGIDPMFSKDYIFELDDYFAMLLKATRENFAVKGSKKYAVLDFTDVEQRILTLNKIEDHAQEDLLKWKEEYDAAQVDLDQTKRYQVPAPTENVYLANLKLSAAKYFRGDDRKILKWGLDLSGGKTVRIGLRDQNGRNVTNPEDIKQAVNELYTRINKMGVAERTIRVENNNIVLDFPGSQGLSASELVKASAMYFHIVNEKFGPSNAALKESVNQFLQDVWNEAVVTNRKDIDSINEIAWNHLGAVEDGQNLNPRSENAKTLFDSGLRLANPQNKSASTAFNDTLSTVAMMRGDESSEWLGQTHPLMFVFHNYALEGSSLVGVQVGYDASEGNLLSFQVKSSYQNADKGSSTPRDDLYAWTSQFAEDRIIGTPKEAYSKGRGWRMAVILNGAVISQPTLRAALRDGGSISGRFSQREVTQLAADLKAGSLSFTPRILSEENVSPELGQEERTKGIVASLVAITLVVVAMVGYYHFAGIVASCAVLFNILIMWGVLQNLGAALTLPGIAGIVLTIGMAVDANVLVFERIREEFAISGRIGSAIQAGYRKAFSAIVDSNITTIIAALILIQFDSGPIRGFAVTLIIGILSSMFTALFMTRYFFAGWVKNPNNKQLTMSQFIGKTSFDFLAQAKKAIALSLIVALIGAGFFFAQTKTMFGMDFTGGYSLNVELQEKADHPNYRLAVTEALLAQGATANDFQIRELSKPNQLRIQLATSMEEKGHPFYQLPENYPEGKYAHSYENNPRIVWLVNTLADANLNVQPSQLDSLDKNWTAMSGQFSDAMRNNAIIGLSIALFCILLYITIRFEFKFAVAAVVGLIHDVIITLGILAIFHKLGFPVQIDLQVVGAIMTIIGYSLNDTIIVFDRIREDTRLLRKLSFRDIINHALNVTLSRTLMTSGTTLLVLLALVLLGGQSIFAFSLVMTIGVIVGTLSSLFIASPVLLYFHNREVKQQHEEMKKA